MKKKQLNLTLNEVTLQFKLIIFQGQKSKYSSWFAADQGVPVISFFRIDNPNGSRIWFYEITNKHYVWYESLDIHVETNV